MLITEVVCVPMSDTRCCTGEPGGDALAAWFDALNGPSLDAAHRDSDVITVSHFLPRQVCNCTLARWHVVVVFVVAAMLLTSLQSMPMMVHVP